MCHAIQTLALYVTYLLTLKIAGVGEMQTIVDSCVVTNLKFFGNYILQIKILSNG